MKLLDTNEAAEIIGCSPTYITQIVKPDKVLPTGHGSRCFYYYQSAILKLKKQRAEAKSAKLAKHIKRELLVPRPSPDHLTLTEAAEFMQMKKGVILKNAKAKIIMRGTRAHRFYLPADLVAIPRHAKARGKGRVSERQCTECGRSFNGRNSDKLCLECRGLPNPEDEYGVMLAPKRQRRKCPLCGGVLYAGQYVCADCKAKRPLVEDYADGFEYLATSP